MQVSERIQGVIIGLLLGFEDGLPLVVFAGNPEDRAVPARSLAHLGLKRELSHSTKRTLALKVRTSSNRRTD